jgi:hypothetical protein
MSIEEKLDLAVETLIGIKVCVVLFWCAIFSFTIARLCWLPSIQAWSGLAAIFMSWVYLMHKIELLRITIEITDAEKILK